MYAGRNAPWPIGWSLIFQTNQVTLETRSTTYLLLERCCRTHFKKSMLLIWSYKRPKSSWLGIRNVSSNTKLLLAKGWWYCKSLVSVFRRIKPMAKLIFKTVVWSAKMRLNWSRRLAELYQSWSLLWRRTSHSMKENNSMIKQSLTSSKKLPHVSCVDNDADSLLYVGREEIRLL